MKSTKKLVSLLLALVLLCACVAGCGGNTNNTANNGGQTANGNQTEMQAGDADQQSTEVAEEDKYGGTFVLNLKGDPKSFNPDGVADDYNFHISQNLYSRLVQMNINEEIMPDLATDWEFSEDGKTVTFHLQENALWHDGEPVTSEDVKFTFETIINEKGHASNGLTDVVSIEAPDEHTVVFNLANPSAMFISTLSWYGTYILPKHIYEGTDWLTNPANMQPIGSGPFKFVSYEPGSSIVFEAFDDYFRGRPYLDQVIYTIIPDTNTAYQAFLNGELDNLAGGFPAGAVDKLDGDPNYKILYSDITGGYDYLTFNFEDENFGKQEVREAVALAVDKDQIVEVALKGLGVPSQYYLPQAYAEYMNDDAKMPERDVEAARACLEAAGYTADENGIYFSCTLDFFTSGSNADIATIIVENLKEAGIDVSLNSMEYAAWNDKVKDGKNFEFTLLGGQQSPDISAAGQRLVTDGSMNFMNYSNPTVDELFAKGSMETDQEKRYEIYKEIQVYLAEDIPQVPLSDYKSKTAIPSYVMDHPWTEPSCIYYSSACWAGTWLDKSQMN